MRASHRSSVAISARADTGALVVRLVLMCLAVAALLLLWTPAVVGAQTTGSAATYRVTRSTGESLHDLAVRLYGDSTRWTELASANNLGTTNSRLLVGAGTQLKVPGRTQAQVNAAVQASSRPTPANRPASSLASQTAGKTNADSAAASRTAVANRSAARTQTQNQQAARSRNTNTQRATPAPVRRDSARVAAADTAARTATVAAANERPLERSGSKIGLVSPEDMRLARGKDQPTIFLGRPATTESEIRAEVAASQKQAHAVAPRTAEYLAAPYPVPSAQLANAGAITQRLNGTQVARDMPRNVRLADEVIVTMPSGVAAAVGLQLIAVHQGPSLPNGAQVAVPTGLLEVVRVESGQRVFARLVRQMGIVEEGQRLIPTEGSAASPSTKATPISGSDLRASVQFVLGDQLLPSIGTYLVLDASATQGVRQGDEFWLVERVGAGADAREQRIAAVRVVRTSPLGSSAIVVKHDRAGIAKGAEMRRVARVE